jgi:anti-anti-sigma factor
MADTMKHLSVDRQGDTVVVTPQGDLLGGNEIEELEKLVRALAAEGNQKLIIDLQKVGYMNSRALGVLIAGYDTYYVKRGAELKLRNCSKRIRDIINITRIPLVIEESGSAEGSSPGS